jgi:microcystin-dependent protein
MSDPFIAEIKIFAGNFAPRGWAFCDGQLLPIAQNTALFSLIGTIYGGDGRTTTGLPNLQGRAPMHPGNGPGLTQRRLGQRGGRTTVTLTSAQLPSHDHALQASLTAASETSPEGNALAGATENVYGPSTEPLKEMSNAALAPAGGGFTAHPNMQPYLGLNFIIALTGVFPSRN